jgi:septum site-determining protein MinD
MSLVVIGISHKTAPVELREKISFPREQLEGVLSEVRGKAPGEVAILSTCNRTEIYAHGPDDLEGWCVKLLERRLGTGAEKYVYRKAGPDMIGHLFRVAGGLDSLVVGENEILKQVKDAYGLAHQNGLTAKVLNVLFQRALYVGKLVRTQTSIGQGSVSVGSVAVSLAEKIFGDLSESEVLVFGAGKMAGKTSLQRSRMAPLDPWTAMKLRIHKALIDEMDLKKMESNSNDPKQREVLREKTTKGILEIMNKEDTAALLNTRELKSQMLKEVLDEALGLGPLEDLLADDSVTEIMVNARDQIYIERGGKNTLSKIHFSSELQMMNVVERIVTPLGRRVDEKQPYVDARLPDGSRVHVIIPPLALRGPTITIRKFPKKQIGVKDLIEFGSVTEEIGDFLRSCVEAKLNIIVSGGTGSGKTTLLNVLSGFIPANERIITIEDSAELQMTQEHVVRLEARPKNIEGEGEVSIRDLVKCSLRMKPDRIVVGECRSGEALDMLQAMNTGHDGSLTTLHANTPREAMQRLETLVMMAGLQLPSKAIRETIASAVGLVIQQARLSDGSRKVTQISEVVGMQGDVITLQDIFIYKQEGLDKKRKIIGRFVPTGFVPKFVEAMEEKGMKVSRRIFGGS